MFSKKEVFLVFSLAKAVASKPLLSRVTLEIAHRNCNADVLDLEQGLSRGRTCPRDSESEVCSQAGLTMQELEDKHHHRV